MAAAKKTATKAKPEPIEGVIVQPVQAIAVRQESSTSPNMLIQHAIDTQASPEYLMQLLQVKREWEADERKKAFSVAFAAFKREPLVIGKNKHVFFKSKNGGAPTDYWHAELSDLTAAIGPAMAKHGLSYSWEIDQTTRPPVVIVTCVVEHEAGHTKRVQMECLPDNSGNKNGIQQIASAATYLRRHTLEAAAGVSTKGNDDDGRSAGRKPEDDGDSEPRGQGQDEGPPDPLIVDLNSAADEGTEALDAAWAELSVAQRNRVGKSFLAIKERARRNDPR